MKDTKAIYFAAVTARKSIDAYNKWAHGKPLARDVIVHTEIVQPHNEFTGTIIILVFFDEQLHPDWAIKDTEQEPDDPKQRGY